MMRCVCLIAFVTTILLAGCNSDIVTTSYLKEVNPKGMDPVRLINHDKEPPRDRALPVNGNP